MFQEVPLPEIYRYYKRRGKKQKVKQIRRDLFDLWKYNSEDYYEDLLSLADSKSDKVSTYVEVF